MHKSAKKAYRCDRFWQTLAVWLCLGILLSGCRSPKTLAGPTIEFTKIPPAAQGGRERVDTIAGGGARARAGQQMGVYAGGGPWGVHPGPGTTVIPIPACSPPGPPPHP